MSYSKPLHPQTKPFNRAPSKLETFLAVPNKSETEPALKVGGITATVAGLLSLIAFISPNLLNEKQTTIVLVVAAIVLPIVTAVLTRGRAWSVASVEEVIDEAVSEALRTLAEAEAKKEKKLIDPSAAEKLNEMNTSPTNLYALNADEARMIKNYRDESP